jgi:hypothetical protein
MTHSAAKFTHPSAEINIKESFFANCRPTPRAREFLPELSSLEPSRLQPTPRFMLAEAIHGRLTTLRYTIFGACWIFTKNQTPARRRSPNSTPPPMNPPAATHEPARRHP